MFDAAVALGFATAMVVSGVNIVGIEQQRDFAPEYSGLPGP
jgi:hypothetical protein